MTQIRLWNYGDTFTSEKVSTSQIALHSPGVYTGYRITVVDTDKVALSPGFALLPNGILVGESTSRELVLSIAPAAPTTYTLTVRHTDSDTIGGSPALYALELGEILPADVPDGLVLAYIRHPGSAVALDSSFIFESRVLKNEAEDLSVLSPTFLPSPLQGYFDVVGANTSVSSSYTPPLSVVTRVETDGLGPVPPGFETSSVRIPLLSSKFRPFSLSVRAQIDPNSELRVYLTDTAGNPVSLSSNILGPSATFLDYTVSIDYASGVFTEGDPYLLTLEFRTPQLDSIDVQSITITYDPLP